MAFPLPPSPPPRYILVAERRLSTKETMSAFPIRNLASFSRRDEDGYDLTIAGKSWTRSSLTSIVAPWSPSFSNLLTE